MNIVYNIMLRLASVIVMGPGAPEQLAQRLLREKVDVFRIVVGLRGNRDDDMAAADAPAATGHPDPLTYALSAFS